MRVLASLTYYRPYTSGLTIYAERLARALSERKHAVKVLCMQHEKHLPRDEMIDGVHIIRAPIWFRLTKGFISGRFLLLAIREVKKCDVVHLHLPQFEGAFVAIIALLFRKPIVVTYHCDLIMPNGLLNKMAGFAVNVMNRLTATLAKKIVTYTEDFAANSPFLKRYLKKVAIIYPPVVLPSADEADKKSVFERANVADSAPCIGMAARLAAEKGVEVLVDAINFIISQFPRIKVLFAGPYLDVIGEGSYRERVLPRIRELEKNGHWVFLGNLTPSEMSAFYPLLSALTVPSLNSTESFGLVQIEAMQHGVPVISSDLPGVRQPVTITGMGKVVPIGDARALSAALTEILTGTKNYSESSSEVKHQFDPARTAEQYERIYDSLIDGSP